MARFHPVQWAQACLGEGTAAYDDRVLRAWSFEDAVLRPTTRGWVLAGLLAGGAVIAWLSALTPETRLAQTGLTAAVAVAQVVLALLAVRFRQGDRGLWTIAAVAVLLVTVLVVDADTVVRLVLTSSTYAYFILYAAYAFERRAMSALLSLIVAGSTVGAALSSVGIHPVVWLSTVGGVCVVGVVVGQLITRLRFYATIDSLTGVLTRTAFDAVATATIAGCRRRGEPLAMAVIDLDEFKSINDQHGHAAGDAMLGEVVDAWRSRLRSHDHIGRIGGDEFALLLPGATEVGAQLLLADLAEVSPLAFSAGVAVAGDEDDVAAVRRSADASMYAAKRGKPRVAG